MSAEAWRRTGSNWRRCMSRDRRDTFSTSCSICVAGVDDLGRIGAAAFYVPGMALSALQPRFAWQAWHFQYLHRCPRKLGDELGRIGAAACRVTGVALSAPQARFAWQAWRFQYLYRCPRKLGDELGRIGAAACRVTGVTLSAPQARFAWQVCGTFSTSIDVHGSLATKWVELAPLHA